MRPKTARRNLAAVASVVLGLSSAPAHGLPAPDAEPSVSPDGYTSARVCGECHQDIYKTWQNSLHAFSVTDPIFDAAYMESLKIAGDRAKRLCLSCHAPMTQVNGDFDMKEGVTREGVSCDFCHTITAVHLDRAEAPYTLAPGLVKRSVLERAASPAHEVAYSKLHGTSEFCAGCHNLVTPSGAELMGTYTEWRDGPYAARGIHCQDCHMKRTRGKVVRPEFESRESEFHVHSLIHDSDQLKSALALRLLSTAVTPEGLVVTIEIENVGSGHMVPTGIPSREVTLAVKVERRGFTRTETRRYRKVVADANNRVLERDAEILLQGSKVLNDNRIAPGEKRVERLVFRMSDPRGANVTATLSYVYAPLILKRQRLDIQLGEVAQRVE